MPARTLGRVDLASAGPQRVPIGAEGLDPLAVRVAAVSVLRVVVQRVALVGDLLAAVRTRRRAEVRRHGCACRSNLAARLHRRPCPFTGTSAGGRRAVVPLEPLHGPAPGARAWSGS